MIISFDLTGIFCLIVIPPLVLYLCKFAWELGTTTRKLVNNKYLRKSFEKNNKVYRENIRLSNEIANLIEKDDRL